jgi:hypothetical protein
MKTKQFSISSTLSKTALKTKALTQLMAVGSLAIGAAAIMPAAPAGAVSITNGQLVFSDGTTEFQSKFVSGTTPIAPPSTFDVDFNSSSPALTRYQDQSGSFTQFFPSPTTTSTISSSTGMFSYLGTGLNYKLDNDLDFVFTSGASSGLSITIGKDSEFSGAINSSNGVGFTLTKNLGSFFKSGVDPSVDVNSLSFNFGDIGNQPGGAPRVGTYGIVASPSKAVTADVPEPFTIIGTIIGGTAAFRMRKKLSNARK